MKLDAALNAGELAKKIKARQEAMLKIQAAHLESWQISRLTAIDPTTGNEISLILDTLDAETSKKALEFAMGVYQAQMDALQTQLDLL